MPKVLLVDTNRAAVPIYRTLVEGGHEVFVVGGNPSEPLAKISKNYLAINYSSLEALQETMALPGYDFLVPGCTDLSYQVCSTIGSSRYCNIDDLETFATLNEKDRFREFAQSIGLPVPQVITDRPAHISGKVMVKPVDSFSGRGISILEDAGALQVSEAIQRAKTESKAGLAIIEEFVTGQLYSFSAFISSAKIVADFVVREDCGVRN